MKNPIMKELSCATFFVDLTAEDAIFHADSNNVQAVFDRLQDITTLPQTLGFVAASRRRPARGFPVGVSARRVTHTSL
jgi:hypothetical protein